MFVSVLVHNLLSANFVDFLQIAALSSALRLSYFVPYVSVAQFREVPKFVACNCVILYFNPLNAELNPICYMLVLLGARHFLHVSRLRVKLLTLRLLMSYICMEHPFLMFLDHTQRRSTVGRTPLDE